GSAHSPEPRAERRHEYTVPLPSFVAAYTRSTAMVGEAETGVPIRLVVHRTSPARLNVCRAPSVPKTPHPMARVPSDTAGDAIDPTSSVCRQWTVPSMPTEKASPAFVVKNVVSFARAGEEASEPFGATKDRCAPEAGSGAN